MKALRHIADARIQSATKQIMAEIKAEHPEASNLLLSGRTNVGLKQPRELGDHLASIIGRVLTDPGAQVITYAAWTDELNKAFGNRFNPGTFFSKKRLGRQLRARLNSTFAARGLAPLPEDCETLAQAMKAAKAARLGNREDATRFAGGVGRIVGNRLVLGRNTFAIKQHGGHDCIRVSRGDGSSGRIRLSDVEGALVGSGLTSGGGGQSCLSTFTFKVGDRGQSSENVALDPKSGGAWTASLDKSPISSDVLAEQNPPEPEAPVLVLEWRARLTGKAAERRAIEQARAAELAAVLASGIDPLES